MPSIQKKILCPKKIIEIIIKSNFHNYIYKFCVIPTKFVIIKKIFFFGISIVKSLIIFKLNELNTVS